MKDSTENQAETEPKNRDPQSLIYIFGPCSAESEDQVLMTANEVVKKYPNAIFRSGIWKPRTRPNNFEGIGEKGLPWLQKVKKETGLRVATEVANTHHVELCLKAGIDVLWLGARTTVNPFYVQEIAEALKGVDISVYVKNPISPDLNLWIGAIERIEQAGITNVVAIHRGFQNYDSKPFRNLPQWEIPIELMAKRPDIPIICDISHICGNPKLFAGIAQKALDLNMAGLHVEVHPNPESALSDAKQQITPNELFELIEQLKFRKDNIDDPGYQAILELLRREIDDVDAGIVKLLFNRMEIIKKIGALKKENQITILQVNRWKEVVDHYITEGKAMGLSESFIKEILNSIHDESMLNQHDILNN